MATVSKKAKDAATKNGADSAVLVGQNFTRAPESGGKETKNTYRYAPTKPCGIDAFYLQKLILAQAGIDAPMELYLEVSKVSKV